MNKIMFYILFIVILGLFFHNQYESFDCGSNSDSDKINLFYKPLPNIYVSSSYSDNKNFKITDDVKPLSDITIDSYIYSDPISTKIICSNYTNQANCWDDNNCQWISKIDSGSYCDVAPKWLL
jgi:hypothetical protein